MNVAGTEILTRVRRPKTVTLNLQLPETSLEIYSRFEDDPTQIINPVLLECNEHSGSLPEIAGHFECRWFVIEASDAQVYVYIKGAEDTESYEPAGVIEDGNVLCVYEERFIEVLTHICNDSNVEK